MKVPIELYQRLSEDDLDLLNPNSVAFKENDMITLKSEGVMGMESGYITASYIVKLHQYGMFGDIEVDTNALKSVRIGKADNGNQRVHNWSVIAIELERVGIRLDPKFKSNAVSGNHEQIVTVLLKLFDIEIEGTMAKEEGAGGLVEHQSVERPDDFQDGESPSKLSIMREVKPEEPIDILHLDPKTKLDQTRTTLEFVVISLVQSMNLSLKQAAGLLTDHNYYLMHACIKGLKGDYSPVLSWYKLLINSTKHLIDLAVESLPVPDHENDQTSLNESQINEEDTQPLFVLLSALKCGFFSEYFTVSDWAFKLFSQISTELNNNGYQKVFAKWFLQQPDQENGKLGGGLEATLYMLSKHSQIAENVALLLISTFKGRFELLIPEIQDNHIKNDMPKLYTLINDLIPFLHKHHKDEVVEKIFQDSLLIFDLINYANSKKPSENSLKSASISLLAEIWSLEPQVISENPKPCPDSFTVLENCLKVFKNTCKFASKSMKMSVIGLMFKLLDQFANSRDNQAPVIYKLLTFTIIENITDDDIREFMMRCFTNVFAAHKTIPVSILVEPILRTMQLNEVKFQANCLDFTFFQTLSQHPKLQSNPLGLQIMDQLARITLNESIWCYAAKVPFLSLAERFRSDPQIQDFLVKFCTLAINSVIQLKKPSQPNPFDAQTLKPPALHSAGVSQLRNLKNLQSENSQKSIDHDKEVSRKIKLGTIVQVVGKILKIFQFQNPQNEEEKTLEQIRDEIKDIVMGAARRFYQIYGDYSKALLSLIEHFYVFNAKEALSEYIKRKDEADRPQPNEDDIRTVIREDLSHIHEERDRTIIMETHSHRMSEVPTITSARDNQLRHMTNNQFDNDEYFRILPSEDTQHSEMDFHDVQNLKNNQSTRKQYEPTPHSRDLAPRDGSQENFVGGNQLVPYNPSTQISLNTNASKPPYKSTKLNLMAQKHIDAIKNKREEKALKQREEEEKKKQNFEKNVQKAKEEVIKRRVQLGVSKSSLEQQPGEGQLVLYEPQNTIIEENFAEEDVGHERNHSSKRFSMPNQGIPKIKDEGIRLIDLENEEEERDKDGVRILLNKYSKVFKFLFNKYAMSRAQHMKVEKFEYFGDKSINLAEISKLLRDHELLASNTSSNATSIASTSREISALSKINKDQISSLIRQLNLKNFKRQDLSALSFNHFMELIPQLAYVVCQNTLGHLSLPDMLLKLLQHNERVTKAKGQSTILYEDPDISTIGDQEILKELNRRIKENPDIILPEGYYKVTEKDQVFKYELPQYLQFKDSKRVAIEVLDSIVEQALGFHFLEAIVAYESRYKVKPRIKHGGAKQIIEKEANSALAFMKPIDKKPFNRDLSGLKLPSSGGLLNPATPGSAGQIFTPITLGNKKDEYIPEIKLTPALKLEVISLQNTKPDLKSHISSVGEVLEELLQVVTSGDPNVTHLPDRSKPLTEKEEIKNKAQEDKEARERQERLIKKQREDIRKKRHEKLKEEIERQKEEKAKKDEEQKAEREEKEREEKRKQRIERTLLRQKNETKRKEIEEAKAKKAEEKEIKVKEEEEVKNKEKQGRAKEQKEFFKKQKEQLEVEFQRRRQEIEEAEKAKKEMEDLKKQQQERVKSKIVSHIVQNKDQNRNEQAEWQEINNFNNDPEVNMTFMKYEKAFGKFFKHFAVMDKKDMEVHSKQRINLNEFQKFGFQKGIVPKLITNEEMTLIFRDTLREKAVHLSENDKEMLGVGINSLGIDDFKKALIRICILAQDCIKGDEKLENILPTLASQPERGLSQVRVPKNVKIRGRSQIHSRGSQRGRITQLQKQDSQNQIEANLSQDRISQQLQPDGTPIATSTKPISQVRKTKEQKILEELAKAKEREQKLMNFKIDSDKRFNKAFDVSVINPRTIEGFIQYLGVAPNDEKRNAKLGLDPSSFLVPSQQKQEGPDEEADGLQDHQDEHRDIEGVDMEELEKQTQEGEDALDTENLIGPDGKQENWKVAQ